MTTELTINIEEIVQTVFSTMLNLDVVELDGGQHSDPDSLFTAIQISGEWMGGLVLEMSPSMARAASSAMLGMTLDELTQADQEETGAELINMIGGNVKCLMPGPSILSLPTVVAGREIGLRIPSTEQIDEVCMGSDIGYIRVCIYAKTDTLAKSNP